MEATHFIEQWKNLDGEICNSFKPHPIEVLKSALVNTIYAELKTIAIFKIKYK